MQSEKSTRYAFVSFTTFWFFFSSCRRYNYARNGTMRPSLVSVPEGQAISSSARVSPSGLTPTRTTVTPLASPRAFDAGVQQLVHDVPDVIFDFRIQDYYLAPHAEIPAGTEKTPAYAAANSDAPAIGVQSTSIAVTSSSDMVRQLELQRQLDNGKCVSVDLGQVARGHRYAYQASTSSNADSESPTSATSTVIQDAASILETGDEDCLVTADGGLHVIPMHDPVVALALLGKIYPGNVILPPRSGNLAQAEKAGKGLEPKFVLLGGEAWWFTREVYLACLCSAALCIAQYAGIGV
ncbi:hypothetical protein IFM61606_10325 [Aspergillus udagawae]|uniref:Uncharacterized protein n=1 Tax=Aspergillus udagawae TaxID=91492 RepID=A0ABQ1BA83_9EURO|nr:hypothetical protein IFM61606_10325 [Aspergillus udagawae]GFF38209.1 hypothetical protein IFM51744_03717 [Aspergillus udagawae]GFF97249.1 hypothetical protein IFM53868_08978 [Aspergillus udagawae]GFG08877.1 hypothetical protein IFM5058_04143 [Aspergillus udagawae]